MSASFGVEPSSIGHLLGGRKVLGREVNTQGDLMRAVDDGLPYASLEKVARKLGLETLEEKSEALGVSQRTLQRRADKRERLDRAESDAVVRLARIAQLAETVLEDMGKAHRWLREPIPALGGRRPIEIIHTEVGGRMIEDVLLRLEHTVYG